MFLWSTAIQSNSWSIAMSSRDIISVARDCSPRKLAFFTLLATHVRTKCDGLFHNQMNKRECGAFKGPQA
ncbi:hypothetical protein Y032_0029g1946 [Ancylostoma ceylanicum]|uniref:Uncharacterized protein n=1 Tax=Ancylostoma ceylanicum TaxID=53326 RepID=A0A016USU0_9BILA|nr:hypothetical protein Y032_0029g1946 [Ancylostoma ceylanicum]